LLAGLGLPLRAAGVVAMVYAHFLIFAQFAWLELMRTAGSTPITEKIALGTMAVAGITAGFLASRRNTTPLVLRAAFIAAAISAAVSPWASSMPAALFVSLLTGASIGTMTISLAPLLPRWCGIGWVGLGTGIGYALCNFPPVFLASPAQQAGFGAVFALLGAALVPRKAATSPIAANAPTHHGIVAVIAAFTALVWLDSAAFFIIQHERDLKSATWGEPLLWRNAAVHVAAAVLAGLTLRRGFSAVLAIAWAILAAAVLAVNDSATRAFAGWIYPVGVSLYSTALVAWPGFFSPDAEPRAIARRAAWLYAVAGWFGSANGIGMVQSLHHVPAIFIIIAGAVVLGTMLLRRNQWPVGVAVVTIVCLACIQPPAPESKATAIERGRAVYLAEGCIHCHSRYVRPGSPDELRWGPVSDLTKVLAEKPVLIGNRRQGPDLTNAGARRSEAWLKLHFLNPRDFSPDSPMPSYVHLFKDTRGDDLMAFLRDVPADAISSRVTTAATWTPQPATPIPDGAPLFLRHCAACHGPVGHGDGKIASSLVKRPTDLDRGPFVWTPSGPDLENRIARAIKFGLPGTDMPGHETLDDARIVALARYIVYLRKE
jgi:mono/diheme cytochrome c family protein